MTKFADHLFQDLMAEHGDALTAAPATAGARTPARRRLTRPVWASAGTVAAAGAAALGFTVFGGTASAYAVTDNHDGTYTVKVDNPGGIAGANDKLKGMKSRVAVVQAKPGCPPIEAFAAPGRGGDSEVTVGLADGSGPGSITVSASGLPADETALVVYSFEGAKSTVGMVPIKGQVPTCVSLPATPPGTGTGGNGAAGLHSDTGSGDAPALSRQNK